MRLTILSVWFAMCLTASAAERPQLRDVTTVPRFVQRKDAIDLRIDGGKEPINILWSIELQGDVNRGKTFHYFPVTLASNSNYTFTVEEQRICLLDESKTIIPSSLKREDFMMTRHTLVRISRDGTVLWDREVCEVHKRKMARIDAPIIYGLIIPNGPQPTLEQMQTGFPHYREVRFGGCVVGQEKTEKMFVCSDCKAAYAKWENAQPARTK